MQRSFVPSGRTVAFGRIALTMMKNDDAADAADAAADDDDDVDDAGSGEGEDV